MKNVSSILPNTAHVYLDLEAFLGNSLGVRMWLLKNGTSRVDVFAYEADDPLDHQHLFAFVDQSISNNLFAGDLTVWMGQLRDDGQAARVLLAFEDHAVAMLFKLTFGGAA